MVQPLGTFQHVAAEIREKEGRKPRVYVSGAMSGVHQKNMPAFVRAEKFFQRMGFEVLNPVVNERRVFDIYDAKTWSGMSKEEQWQAFMAVDEKLVKRADIVIGMEKGAFGSKKSWQESRGAKIERRWAQEGGKPFYPVTSAMARMLSGKTTESVRGSRTRELPQAIRGNHQNASVRYWLDLETQGLRTKARSQLPGIPARRAQDRLRLSQISFGREVAPGMLDFLYGSGDIKMTEEGKNQKVFTDIITEELLKQSNVTDANALNDEFLKRVTRHDMKGFWDVGVFVEGNPLRAGLQRHVRHVLEGRKVHSETSVVEGMLDRMLQDLHGGKKVEIAGWNIGFDWSRIQEVAQNTPRVSRKLQQVMLAQNFRLREAAEPIFEMTWNLMKHDASFVPRFTDRAKLEKLARENKNLRGAIVEHEAMRSFMDIVSIEDQSNRFNTFQKRFGAHLRYGESQEIASELASIMSPVQSFEQYKGVVEQLKGGEDRYQALRALFERSFKPSSGRHVSLLGRAGRDESVLTTGFNFMLGWKQEQVANALHEMATNPEDRKMIGELLKAGLHDSDIDVMTTSRISRMLTEISEAGPNSSRFQDFVRRTLANEDAFAAGFAEDIAASEKLQRAFGKAVLGPEKIAENQAMHWIDKLGIKRSTFWAGAAVLTGGLYLLGEHNAKESDNDIEGLRRPIGQWNTVPGIDPNTEESDFGSGRSILSQLLGNNYIARLPADTLQSRAVLMDLQQIANRMKPNAATFRGADEAAMRARDFRAEMIDLAGLPGTELVHGMEGLAQRTADGLKSSRAIYDAAYRVVPETAADNGTFATAFHTNWMPARNRDYARLAVDASDDLRDVSDVRRAEWYRHYAETRTAKLDYEGKEVQHLVNELPRRMAPMARLEAGHAGLVQHLGRMSRKSFINDKFARLADVNPAMAQFKPTRPKHGAARASRMEACAC